MGGQSDLQEELDYQSPPIHTRKERTHKKTIFFHIVFWILSLSVWSALIYGGYTLADNYIQANKAYIDQQVDEVENENSKQFQKIESDIAGLSNEMTSINDDLKTIQDYLELTGETIDGTNETKQALQQKIDELNEKLNELQRSLEKLEDASSD